MSKRLEAPAFRRGEHVTTDEFDALLKQHLAPIREQLEFMRRDLTAMQPNVAGIPLLHRAIEQLRHESRQIRICSG
jgi:hypothetical protein